jgi:signal peptidase I
MKKLKGWKELAFIFVLAMLAAFLVRTYLLTPYRVPTGSMQPALKPGDFIFVSQLAYSFNKSPQRGDLVTFYYSNQPGVTYVKRIIALPGDRVEIKKNRLIINGTQVSYTPTADDLDNPNSELFEVYSENYNHRSWKVIFNKGENEKTMEPLIVPPNEFFVMGDNRDASDDSRYWGTVPMEQIFGKVSFIWLSLDWQKKWAGNRFPSVRWERIFSRVH